MAGLFQHFENAAHHLAFTLDRLIRIGVGADRNHLRLVFGGRQLFLKQRRRVGLYEQLRFEIQSGRKAEIGVGRPREAIDAAVLATAIGIDRTVEADIRRLVAGDDFSRRVDPNHGLERRKFIEALPAVVEGDPRLRLKAAAVVGLGAATASPLALDRHIDLGKRGRHTRRFGGRRDRRVLEGSDIATHEATIAHNKNKART